MAMAYDESKLGEWVKIVEIIARKVGHSNRLEMRQTHSEMI
jgi:hypothetical protein